MALVIGTNAGFVETAPVADPGGSIPWVIDNTSQAVKDTSPATAGKVTEIGWWCDNATPDVNFEVGLYSHSAPSDKPDARLYVDNTNAKGTNAGWKTVIVDWEISPDTIYWIAVQVDNTTETNTDGGSAAGASRYSYVGTETTLLNPWPSSSQGTNILAFYAKWETGVTYSELAGTIASVSTVSGNLDTTTISQLAGTIAATSLVSGNLGFTTVSIDVTTSFIKRLVVAGNNQIQYESI